MARDSSGSHNEPVYLGTGAPATAADMNEIVTFAKALGNVKVGTSAGRVTLTGADLWAGLSFFETDTNSLYLYDGAAWRLVWEDTGWVTSGLTIATGTGFSLSGYELRRRAGVVSGVVTVTRTGTTVTPDSSGNFGDLTGVVTMPVGWRYTGTSQDSFLVAQQSGVASFFARLRRSGVGADGQIDITHGIPSQTLPQNQNISLPIHYLA